MRSSKRRGSRRKKVYLLVRWVCGWLGWLGLQKGIGSGDKLGGDT